MSDCRCERSWSVVTLAGWRLPLHIWEWAQWFVWDRSGKPPPLRPTMTQPRYVGPRERETSVLCHECWTWSTPPFTLYFPVSLTSRLLRPLFLLPLLNWCVRTEQAYLGLRLHFYQTFIPNLLSPRLHFSYPYLLPAFHFVSLRSAFEWKLWALSSLHSPVSFDVHLCSCGTSWKPDVASQQPLSKGGFPFVQVNV